MSSHVIPAVRGPRDRRWERWQVAVLAACAVALIASHAPLIGYKAYANVDEAYAAALAQRLNDGFRLYEGAVSQRGPLMYYSFAGLAWAFGWDNIVAVRIAALLLCLAHVAMVMWVGTRLLSRRAGILGAIVSTYTLFLGLPALDGMALHAESMQVPILVGAAASAVLATRAQAALRLRWLVLSGLLYGAAIAIKQSALLQPLPTLLWLVAESHRHKARRLPVKELLVFVGAGALVPLAFIAHAAANGTLDNFLYYTLTYNLRIHLKPSEVLLSSATLVPVSDEVTRFTAFFTATMAIALATAGFFVKRVRRAIAARSAWVLARGFDLRVYFALHFLVAVASGAAMYRFFPHYFVPAVPFLALAIAAWTRRPVARAGVSRAIGVAAAATLVFAAVFTTYLFEKIDGRVSHGPAVQKVGAYLEATTKPDSRIFVWGFSPWLYGYSHRRPAGRYVFETYVTGFVPWFHDSVAQEPARTVPGSMDALLNDLDRETPEVVVDAGSVMIARPMRAYPAAAQWLRASYCFEVRMGAYDIYRRKAAGTECASKRMPRPHAAVDYGGNAMLVPMTRLAPGEPGEPLCMTTFSQATWFSDAPPPPRVDLLMAGEKHGKLEKTRAAGVTYSDELSVLLNCSDR